MAGERREAAPISWMEQFLGTYFPTFFHENAERIRQRAKELEQQAPVMAELLEHPGWRVLVAQAEQMLRTREALIVQGDGTRDERMKGEHAGIRLVLEYPQRVVEDAKRFTEEGPTAP